MRYAQVTEMRRTICSPGTHCTVIIQTAVFLLFLGDINVLWMSLYLCDGKMFLFFFCMQLPNWPAILNNALSDPMFWPVIMGYLTIVSTKYRKRPLLNYNPRKASSQSMSSESRIEKKISKIPYVLVTPADGLKLRL